MANYPTFQPWPFYRKLLIGGIVALMAPELSQGVSLPATNSATVAWTPKVHDTWQIMLSKPPLLSATDKSTATVFDVDLFDTPVETIQQLHNLGKKVICYFSAGSYENWRPDANSFQPADLGKGLDGWPGENWLKLSSANVRNIMKARIQMAAQKGCDGVDPDNVDGYVSCATLRGLRMHLQENTLTL